MEEVLPGIFVIPWYNFDASAYFNGHFIKDGAVLVDPPKMDNYELMEIARQGPPKNIIITNSDHVREADHYRRYFGAKVWINRLDADGAKIKADKTFKGGDKLPGNIIAINIPDNKLPGETALLLEKRNVMILGDALVGNPKGELNLLPPDRFKDFALAKEGIRTLLSHRFEHVLVAHGFYILNEGRKAMEDCLRK